MNKKSLIIAAVALVMLFSLAGCGGDKADPETFEYNWEYVLSHLPAEFSIKYTVTFSDEGKTDVVSYKVIRTSRGYCFEGEDGPEDSLLYIKNGDKYDQYYYDDYEEIFILNAGYPQTSQDSIDSVFFYFCGMYMTPWSSTSGMTKNGSQEIAGRNCDKYTYSVGAFGQSVTYTYFIDKTTGVCLKMSYTATVAGASGGYEFVCTEFKTTGPALPAYK